MNCLNLQLVYTICIIPIAVARFVDFSGNDVPFWLTIAADFLFNLNGELLMLYLDMVNLKDIKCLGFFNVLLFAATYRRIPLTYLPSFSEPRKSLHITNFGITPFILPAGDEDKVITPKTEQHEQDAANAARTERRSSVSTVDSFASENSTAPLTRH